MEPAPKKQKLVHCTGENCTQTRIGVDKSWHGRMCGTCKAKVEAQKRASQTFQSWKSKVDKSGKWGKEPNSKFFVNQEEYQLSLQCWKENTALTFETWLQGHQKRKNAKGLGSKGSLTSIRGKFKDDHEWKLAMEYWENNHKYTESYNNQSKYQKDHLPQIKQTRRKNGTNKDTRICQGIGEDGTPCTKVASFGGSNGKRMFCGTHKEHGMVNFKNPCQYQGCSTQPSYGPIGGKPIFCSNHARNFLDYIDLITNRCVIQGCNIMSSYGEKDTTQRTHCAKHGKELGLVDTKSKMCSVKGCVTTAGFGFPGESRSRCMTHMEPGMINVIQHYCKHSECSSPAYYGPSGSFPEWCDKHKIQHENILFNPTKTCQEPGCRQYATHGSYHNPMHCSLHIGDKHISLIETKCIQCHLVDICSPITNKCEHCCARWKLSTRKSHERGIKHLFDLHEIDYIHEQVIGNTKLVPDFLIQGPTHSIVIEVDENQHKNSRYSTQNDRYDSRESENLRMVDMNTSNPNIHLFIRYNPDEYSGGNAPTSERHNTLISLIQQATTTSYDGIYMVKLFYDHYTQPTFHKLI